MNFAVRSWTGATCANDSAAFSQGATQQYATSRGTGRVHARPSSADFEPDTRAFLVAGERMLASARHHGQPLSLLVLTATCLPEVEAVFGRKAAHAVVRALMEALEQVAGRRGLAVRTLHETFAVAVPKCTPAELKLALRNQLGQACCVDLDFRGEEILLVPDVQVDTVAHRDSFARVYADMYRAMESRRNLEEQRREHLRRRREALTAKKRLPAELPDAPVLPSSGAWGQRFPETFAMPLARR